MKTKKRKARQSAVSLPSFGLWERFGDVTNDCYGSDDCSGCGTGPGHPPPAATTIGLWVCGVGVEVRLFAAMYCDEFGEPVDPYTEDWKFIRCECRQGGAGWEPQVVEPPDYWAETRFLQRVPPAGRGC